MVEIFTFGSNFAGRHGLGAAKEALDKHGAIYGRGFGLQGRSFAIPTKDGRNRARLTDPAQTLAIPVIATYVDRFIEFARNHPEYRFNVTAIGCGKAGYRPPQIAPLFADAPDNCALPPAFLAVLGRSSAMPSETSVPEAGMQAKGLHKGEAAPQALNGRALGALSAPRVTNAEAEQLGLDFGETPKSRPRW